MGGLTDDRAAWIARHVLPHEPALRTWLKRRGVAGLEIDDVVQETYAALASRETVADIINPKAYCFQAARSVVLMHLRRARVVTIRAVEDLDRLGAVDGDPSPERQLSDREELQHLGVAIARLPQPGRAALMLRMIDGLSQREVGRRLGISENAAQKHIAKSIHLLMVMLGRGGNPDVGASNLETKESRPRHERSRAKPRD
jgi:RNA polymerase sigma-70 factor (ECF subfamily)